ncbi:MAG: S41 family peptidase [Dysgonamonadaceae bacterium]|jgi:hypothetical protein|nr:S41 family peptidase [Dysgonamonadaceae bacterium]
MTKTISIICLSFLYIFSSCVEIDEFKDTPRGNFEALWKIMDERYCFFSYKEVDWNEIHDRYSAQVKDKMNRDELFQLLNKMLQELQDGHVNLITPFDLGRYWKWFEDYPENFDGKILNEHYLGTDFSIASGMRYKMLEDSIGYIYYGNFSSGISPTSLDYILYKFADCDGIIIDVRNNGGGLLSNATEFASRFTNERKLVGYIQHKTGKGHNDFSDLFPIYLDPSTRIRYQKPVVVLTNRSCYSATNDFVSSMRLFPLVTIMGDKTGGGSGLPMSSELPNGWAVRFSACPTYDADKQPVESGIDPDILIEEWDDKDRTQDPFIEAARNYLLKSD